MIEQTFNESTQDFQADWVSPTGDTIADLLEEKGWSQAEFAERIGYTTKHISLMINGKAAVTEDTAIKLERVLGSSARFWLTREAQYREVIARAEALDELQTHAAWLKRLPLTDMIKFGWIARHQDKGQQVDECLSFFGVASVDAWRTRYADPVAAFKASSKFKKDGAAVSVWLRAGERQAANIVCKPFDKSVFKQALRDLRELTNEADPEKFIPVLAQACAEAGVAVVFEPAPKGCPVSGATRWLSPGKALLMLSLRHKTNDHLWFAFFHEAAHLLLHGKKMLFIEVNGLKDKHEHEANCFARDWLIPLDLAEQLVSIDKTYAAVETFAEKAGIPPAVVVGRMQNEELLDWSMLNKCKVHYTWTDTVNKD